MLGQSNDYGLSKGKSAIEASSKLNVVNLLAKASSSTRTTEIAEISETMAPSSARMN